jgi:D-glycero-D-manno-heptose 1,7-bisphosphate phosphatase
LGGDRCRTGRAAGDEQLSRTIPPPAFDDPVFDIVFLDRDGTMNVRRPGYVSDPAELDLLPGVGEAVAALNRSGARVVLLTNQRGVATGEVDLHQVEQVHSALQERLSRSGAWLDDIFVCPHEDGTCRCRKPAPGLFEQALAAAPWADPIRCVMVGDMVSDVEPAASLGMVTVLVGPEHGTNGGWQRASSLPDAVRRLLEAQPIETLERR